MIRTISLISAASLMLAACAQQPDQIAAVPVSSYPYQQMSCKQLAYERAQVVNSVNALTAAQKQKADSDGAVMAVGMILFWPALFALSAGNDQANALAQAKGQYDAIDTAQKVKGCTITS